MNSDFDRELRRVRNLKQNKDKSDEELYPIVQKNLALRDFKSRPLFSYTKTDDLTEDEKNIKKLIEADQKLVEERFKNYLDAYKIESQSDLDTLSSLIYLEIFEKQIQRELNKIQTSGKYPPDKLTKQLTDIQDQKLDLKVKLGIDREEATKDDLSEYQKLEKKVYDHIQEHKNEHTIGIGFECEKCGHKDWQEYLLWYKVKDFKVLKHPWFVGRWLANYPILRDVKNGELSKEKATEYMLGSGQGGDYSQDYKKYCTDYIDFCLENWTEILDHFEKGLKCQD